VLEAGDVIVEVDGVSLAGKPLRESMALTRGVLGSEAALVVKKPDGTMKKAAVERKRIQIEG
jgi:C-terminal processing protease CtpA/Prc